MSALPKLHATLLGNIIYHLVFKRTLNKHVPIAETLLHTLFWCTQSDTNRCIGKKLSPTLLTEMIELLHSIALMIFVCPMSFASFSSSSEVENSYHCNCSMAITTTKKKKKKSGSVKRMQCRTASQILRCFIGSLFIGSRDCVRVTAYIMT